jgi:hypothetical protein
MAKKTDEGRRAFLKKLGLAGVAATLFGTKKAAEAFDEPAKRDVLRMGTVKGGEFTPDSAEVNGYVKRGSTDTPLLDMPGWNDFSPMATGASFCA